MTIRNADGPAFSYAPVDAAVPSAFQMMTVYTPPVPNGGVILFSLAGNFVDTSPLASFDDTSGHYQWIAQLLDLGWILVSYGLTGGLFQDYDSSDWLNHTGTSWWERDSYYACQKIHQLIDDLTLPAEHHLVGVIGQSGTFVSAAHVAWAPYWRWSSGSSQVQQTARFAFLIGLSPVTWFPGYVPDEWNLGPHFETSPGSGTPGVTLADIPTATLEAGSPIKRYQDYYAQVVSGPLPALVPSYLVATEQTDGNDYSFDAGGLPVAREFITGAGASPHLHSFWFTAVAREKHKASPYAWDRYSRMVAIGDGVLQTPAPEAQWGSETDPDFQADIVAWVQRRLTNEPNPVDPSALTTTSQMQTRLTRLDAVNAMLRVIGSAPVNTIAGPVSAAVAVAAQTLDQVDKEIQSEGWWFNIEKALTLSPDVNGYVYVPNNMLSIDDDSGANCPNIAVRGERLYDLENHTFVFSGNVAIRAIIRLTFEDLPPTAQDAIMASAQRRFQRDQRGVLTKDRLLAEQEANARAALQAEDTRNAGRTLLGNSAVYQFGGRRRPPARRR